MIKDITYRKEKKNNNNKNNNNLTICMCHGREIMEDTIFHIV